MSAVTIGRNGPDGQPIPARQWEAFVRDARQAIRTAGGTVHVTAYGSGMWDGVPEESAVITFDDGDTGEIAAWLSILARRYGQQGIGLQIGTTDMIGDGWERSYEAAHWPEPALSHVIARERPSREHATAAAIMAALRAGERHQP